MEFILLYFIKITFEMNFSQNQKFLER